MLFTEENHQGSESVQYLRARLAVESITDTNVLSIFNRVIPSVRGLISGYMDNLKSLEDMSKVDYGGIDKVYSKVLREASKYNFLAYRDLLVSVPEGFNGTLSPYLRYLLTNGRMNAKIGVEAVKSYNVELSAFLSNAEFRSTLHTHNELYEKLRKEREEHKKTLAPFFKKDSVLSRRPLGSLISRFGELEVVFRDATALGMIREEQNYKVLLDEVGRSVELLTVIEKRSSEGSIEKVSGPMAKHLADGAYEIAMYAEAIAIFGFTVEVAVSSVRNMAEQLKESFNIKN